VAVGNIRRLYIAPGTIIVLKPIKIAATKIANVPFCNPHSSVINVFCRLPQRPTPATKGAMITTPTAKAG